ncbi:MAG: hypothetical protein J0H74_05125 [Chitinophagaceae bacterium]|nr:hypothetical protein [Chitinophagaceae bacterium]
MKKHIIIAGIAILTTTLPSLAPHAHAQVNVSFQVFYDQLSPFGNWVSYPDYGYVWVPGAGAGFRPYGTRGHWVYTEVGWTWVSDYSWGWATFHYGNWFYDDVYGWIWVPGYEWAPAWVTWGEYGGNYCWAPIGPRVDIGVAFSTYRPPASYWVFCPRGRITNVNVSNYYVRNIHNTTVINNITVINNAGRGNGYAYFRGPRAANVERFTHTTVRPVAIRSAERPGTTAVRNGQLAIYRPSIQRSNASVRPTQVRDLHALRPVNNRPVTAAVRPGNMPGPQARPSGRPTQRTVQHPSQLNPVQHPAVQPRQPVQHPVRQPVNRPFQQPMSRPVQQPAQHPVQQARPTPFQPHPVERSPMQQRPNPGVRPMQPSPRPMQRPVTPPPHQDQPHPEHHR